MPTLTLLMLTTLAAYWVWWVLARSSLLARPREALYDRYPPDPVRRLMLGVWDRDKGQVYLKARAGKPPRVSYLAKLVDCPWCAGFWLSGLVVLALDLHGPVPMPALLWPATNIAVGALAILLDGLERLFKKFVG